jgi:hypothetical protein
MREKLQKLLKSSEGKEFTLNDSTFKVVEQKICIYSEVFHQWIITGLKDFTDSEIKEITKQLKGNA